MSDAQVRRYIELRDGGASEAEIAAGLGAQSLAHRIAAGDEPMYPLPDPADRVVDARIGSSWVPIGVLMIVLVGVIVYALVR